MIEKRVRNGEDIDVFAMFGAVCEEIEQVRAPKRSFLGRLFGERRALSAHAAVAAVEAGPI
jgi:hypothetical protein